MSVSYSKIDAVGYVTIPEEMRESLGWKERIKIGISKSKPILLEKSTGKETYIKTLDEFGRVELPLELRENNNLKTNDIVVMELDLENIGVVIAALSLDADRTELLQRKIEEEFVSTTHNKLAEDFAEAIKTRKFSSSDIDKMLVKSNLLEELYNYCVDSKHYPTFITVILQQFLTSKVIDVIQAHEIEGNTNETAIV